MKQSKVCISVGGSPGKFNTRGTLTAQLINLTKNSHLSTVIYTYGLLRM